MYAFYTSYSCLAIQLSEKMTCDKFSTNYAVKMLQKTKDQALVNKKEICSRIIWNSDIITSEILEKT